MRYGSITPPVADGDRLGLEPGQKCGPASHLLASSPDVLLAVSVCETEREIR